MALPTTRILPLIVPTPPNLPLAPESGYSAKYQDQLNSVLRLYFNQLKNFEQALASSTGGAVLKFPYGAFHQDGATALTAAIPNGTSTAAINVTSTTGFPASGSILIGKEIISYTAKTATTFDGTITRHVYGTSGAGHAIGDDVTEVQGVGSTTATGTVLFNNTDESNGVYASADFSRIYFDVPGLYNLQYSAQLLNYDSAEDRVVMWFKKNGNNIDTSASVSQLAKMTGNVPGSVIQTVNLFVRVTADDYVSLAWASIDTGNSVIGTFPSSAVAPIHPVSPAVIFTAQFVSALST